MDAEQEVFFDVFRLRRETRSFIPLIIHTVFVFLPIKIQK